MNYVNRLPDLKGKEGDTIVSISDLEIIGMPYCLTLADIALGFTLAGTGSLQILPGDDLSDNEQTFQFVLSNDRFAKGDP